MSFITAEGIEAIIATGFETGPDYSDTISNGFGGNGWEAGWDNPSGMTGDSWASWNGSTETTVSAAFVQNIDDSLSSIFINDATFYPNLNAFFSSAGSDFSGAAQSFLSVSMDASTGLRSDGRPLGAGCGDMKTDQFVPDKFFKADFTMACSLHDACYATLGLSKDICDANLKSDVFSAMQKAGYDNATSTAVADVYWWGVHWKGQDAYDKAQKEAAEKAGSYH